jgi:hypothetical protein
VGYDFYDTVTVYTTILGAGIQENEGNESASYLAKTCYEHLCIWPELACDISERVAEQPIRDWFNSKHREH